MLRGSARWGKLVTGDLLSVDGLKANQELLEGLVVDLLGLLIMVSHSVSRLSRLVTVREREGVYAGYHSRYIAHQCMALAIGRLLAPAG
jgi:hypothetical protein